jgi:hypothetical protein
VLLGVALVLASAPVNGAEPHRTGPRVRVTLIASGEKIVGQLLEASDEVLVLGRGKDGRIVRLPVSRRDVSAVEVSGGKRGRGRGVKIGALAGIGAALVIGLAAGEDCGVATPAPNTLANFSSNLNSKLCFGAPAMAALSALLTVPLGALVGAAVPPGEKWRTVDPSSFSLGVRPGPGGGVGARLVLRF